MIANRARDLAIGGKERKEKERVNRKRERDI